MKKILAILIPLVLVTGCKVGQIPNPNDANQPGVSQADAIYTNVIAASNNFNDHVLAKDVTPQRAKWLLKDVANTQLDKTKLGPIPNDKAWKIADVCITAERWDQAEKYLRQALIAPADEDRKVNDTLRLARCEAELGHVDQAEKLTRSTYIATPHWKWPILYATYLEIVPAALQNSKGHQLDLARLVEDSIHQHELAQADPNIPSNVGWLQAREFQIRHAWEFIAEIYHAANREDLAAESYSSPSGNSQSGKDLTE